MDFFSGFWSWSILELMLWTENVQGISDCYWSKLVAGQKWSSMLGLTREFWGCCMVHLGASCSIELANLALNRGFSWICHLRGEGNRAVARKPLPTPFSASKDTLGEVYSTHTKCLPLLYYDGEKNCEWGAGNIKTLGRKHEPSRNRMLQEIYIYGKF